MHSFRYKVLIEITAIICVLFGVFVISGWLIGNYSMITLFRGYAPVKFSTGLSLFLCGCAMLLLYKKGKTFAFLYKLNVLLIIGLAFFSFWINLFKLDYFQQKINNVYISRFLAIHHPGHMLLTTSIAFGLIGVSLFFIRSRSLYLRIAVQWILHIVTLVSVVAILGHLYDVKSFYKIELFSPMAIHTAIALFLITSVVSLVNPSLGVTGLFTGKQIGNIMAKTRFPLVASLLFCITYFRLKVTNSGLLSVDIAIILFTTSVVLIILFMIWRTALSLNKIDAQRKKAVQSYDELSDTMEQKVEHRTITLKEALQALEKSQSELKESLQKEKELSEIKSKFVSLASHEFRTPLSTILSSASLIPSYKAENEQAQREKHVERIANSVLHLNNLLEDFLSLGKLEAGKVSIEKTMFSISKFLNELTEETDPLLKKGQRISINSIGDDELFSDKRLLKNILINLIGNAIKFSGENKEITVLVENKNNKLFIKVADKGIGIPAEEMQHLFSSFYRAKNAANIEGTGLGLHIVKRYVNLLEGDINLQSQLEKGTVISITLPRLHKEIA